MAGKSEIQQFLTSRRARLKPEQVAMLAKMSVEYYGRLERGNITGVSEPVLQSLVSALRLNDDEEQHLRDLIQATEAPVRPQRKLPSQPQIRPSLLRILDAMVKLPAIIQNGRLDIVAILRTEVGRGPFDRNLSDLIGELSTRSDEFRVRWAQHNSGPTSQRHQLHR